MDANSLSNCDSEKPVDAVGFEEDAAGVVVTAMPLREGSAFVKCIIGNFDGACGWPKCCVGGRARLPGNPEPVHTGSRAYRELAGAGLAGPSFSQTICNWTLPPDS